jgi:hypothetical protein
VLLAAGPSLAGERAHVDYMIHCMGCHLDDGRGHPPEVPDLRGEMGRMLQVPGGRPYLVQVPGAAQAPVSNAALAAIVNYMLLTFSRATLPVDFEPLSAEEVARWRPDWVHDVMPVRARLLEAIAALTAARPAARPETIPE